MKLGTVLTATDTNPLYCDFIPIFIKAWKTLFPECDIIIVLVGDSIPQNLFEYSPYIKLFTPLEGIHTAFQSQCIRLLYPQLIERNEGVLITDMDMLPMNRFYYEDAIKFISDDTFVSYRDVLLPHEIPMCYNIALPNIWKDMFSGESLEKWYSREIYDGNHGGSGWNIDQLVLIEKFNEYNGKKVILNDRITRYNRIDRYGFNFNDMSLANKIRSGIFSDYHCLRPYNAHKDTNDFIVNNLRKNPIRSGFSLKKILNIK
jgi:hypothetical protein